MQVTNNSSWRTADEPRNTISFKIGAKTHLISYNAIGITTYDSEENSISIYTEFGLFKISSEHSSLSELLEFLSINRIKSITKSEHVNIIFEEIMS